MNLFRMDKEEYRKFRIFINIMVFIAFLAVFFFVELSSIKSKSIISNLVATAILSSLIMMLGVMTIFPTFKIHFGYTLMVFSILILFGVAGSVYYGSFNIMKLIEVMLSFTAFIYGKELVSREGKFISLTALTADSSKKRQR